MIDFMDLVLTPCINAFGRPVTYHYKSGQSLQIQGIFDEETRMHNPINGWDAGDSGVVASRLMIGVRLQDFPEKPDMEDQVTIDQINYYVQEVQVDGQGGAHLVLNFAEV